MTIGVVSDEAFWVAGRLVDVVEVEVVDVGAVVAGKVVAGAVVTGTVGAGVVTGNVVGVVGAGVVGRRTRRRSHGRIRRKWSSSSALPPAPREAEPGDPAGQRQ